MCVMSMVMDRWNPYVPVPTQPWQPWTIPTQPPFTTPSWPGVQRPGPGDGSEPRVDPGISNDELRELLESFRKACEAAETLDRLTGQPDCVDPEKEKLLERVEELERRLGEVERQREE